MIVVLKETKDKKLLCWTGEGWSEDKEQAKQYEVQGAEFRFGEPFPRFEKGEKLGLVQVDSRAKWRMLGVPSPEETLAALVYDQELKEHMCPNAALVLVSDGRIHGVVQVRREALKRNPELLERLGREARERYNQVIVVEEHLAQMDPEDLPAWLADMNPCAGPEDEDEDEEDEGEEHDEEEASDMPWEEAARWAISGMMDRLEWRKPSGSVVVSKNLDGPEGPEFVECTSLESLLRELEDVGQTAWDGEVPWDSSEGGRQFDMEDYLSVDQMLFERCGEQLKELGWG